LILGSQSWLAGSDGWPLVEKCALTRRRRFLPWLARKELLQVLGVRGVMEIRMKRRASRREMKRPEDCLPYSFRKQDFIHIDIEGLIGLREQGPTSGDLLIREPSKGRMLPLDGAPEGQMIVRTVDECPIINPFGNRNSGDNQLTLIGPEDAHVSPHQRSPSSQPCVSCEPSKVSSR
jgi:hypothetical protein